MDDNRAKFRTFMTEFSGYAANVIIVIGFVILQSSGLVESGKSFQQVLLEGALLLLMTNLLRMSFFATGIQRGYASDKWKNSALEHEQILNAVMPNMDNIDDFLEEDYQKRLKMERIARLRGFKYSTVFDEDGSIKDYVHTLPDLSKASEKEKEMRKHQFELECKNIKAAKEASVPLYMANELITRSAPQKRMFRESTKKAALITLISGVVISVFIMVFNGIFTPTGINWVMFWNAVGVAMISVAVGLLSLFSGYTHIVQNLRGDVVDKVHYLKRFKEWSEKKKNGGNNG